jgi:hypothetical protein
MIKIKNIKIVLYFALVIVCSACGITKYRTFELNEFDNYERKQLFLNDSIRINTGVIAYDVSRDITVSLVFDLLAPNIKFELLDVKLQIKYYDNQIPKSNYTLENIYLKNDDFSGNYHSFNEIPVVKMEMNKPNVFFLLQLHLWDFTNAHIPKNINEMTCDYKISYKLNGIVTTKYFSEKLRSKTHRYFWIIRDD